MKFINRLSLAGTLALLVAAPALAQSIQMGTTGSTASTSMISPTSTPMSSPGASALSPAGSAGNQGGGSTMIPTGGTAPPRVNATPVLPSGGIPVR